MEGSSVGAVVFSAGGKIFQFAVKQMIFCQFFVSQPNSIATARKEHKWLEKNGLTSLKLMGVVALHGMPDMLKTLGCPKSPPLMV